MLKDIVGALWSLVLGVMGLSLPIGEYNITFMELFIYSAVVVLILKLLFGWGGSKE